MMELRIGIITIPPPKPETAAINPEREHDNNNQLFLEFISFTKDWARFAFRRVLTNI